MSALVELTRFGARTNSRVVAEVFEKEHKDVLRAIDNLVDQKPELRQRNFAPSRIVVQAGIHKREVRAFEMDRDGFTLIAMGFTGAKALDWKLAFIDAFNRLEAALRARAAEERDVEPLVMRDYSPALAVFREMRQVFPPKVCRAAWPLLGLPSPYGRGLLPGVDREEPAQVDNSIVAWRDACTVDDVEAETPANELWQSFCAWCEAAMLPGVNQTRFGRGLNDLGYVADKGGAGYVLRRGIKLVG